MSTHPIDQSPGGSMESEARPVRNGDECTVVAYDERCQNLSADVRQLSPSLREFLLALAPGDAVEVLLDDGRVVRTRVRGPGPWELGGHAWVVLLHGFRGGYNLARCRPAEWAGWTRRLPAGERAA
jgi:hypothetical protein